MVTVKTVLKSGGEYKPKHVLRIKKMLNEHISCAYKLVCYSDIEIDGVEVRPLINSWPGWWSKLEMFRDPDKHSFYIDLDMSINGDITDIVSYESEFIALNNMNPKIGGIGSAMMGWLGDKSKVYEHFKQNKDQVMTDHGRNRVGTPWLGDQGLLFAFYKTFERYQHVFPGRIKKFDEPGGDIKVYYGRYKPWQRG